MCLVHELVLSDSMTCVVHIPLSVLWSSLHVHKGALRCHYVQLPVQWTGLCFHPVNTQTQRYYGRFCCLSSNTVCDRVKSSSHSSLIAHRSNQSHTLSVRLALQSGCASSSLTMSACPCSLAHISAVEPSSSWRLTSAPWARSACTMSILPWLTANIRAVWPA